MSHLGKDCVTKYSVLCFLDEYVQKSQCHNDSMNDVINGPLLNVFTCV